MRLNLLKYLFFFLAILAASMSGRAQVVPLPIVEENFQSWVQQGYTSYTDCETNSIANGTITVVKTYPAGQVTYTLDSCAVNPTCNYRTGGTNATCLANTGTSNGYVYIDKDGGAFTTSSFASVTRVDLKLSFTGSYRQATLLKSTDGIIWTPIDTTKGSTCSQYGETFDSIYVTGTNTNVMLRIIPQLSNHPTNTPALNHVRVHDFIVYGSIVAGLQNSSWAESGISLSVIDKNLTVTSDKASGAVDIISLTGAVAGQKEIKEGGQVSFVLPASGLYVVRVTSGDKVYNKKIVVN
jgi:hypothetical protein